MVREDLIGKCGVYKEYPEEYKGKIYYEYFHNNGIIEGTLKKYMKTWMDDSNSEFRLCSEVNYINGKRNGTGIKYNLFDEPHIWLEYVNDELISLKSYFKDKDGNNDYFKFYFYNDMTVSNFLSKLEINNFTYDFEIDEIHNFKYGNMNFHTYYKNNSLEFYWNERCCIFCMDEFF